MPASGSNQHAVAARVAPVAGGQVSNMIITADLRLRAEPPLPPAAFGNWAMLLPTVQLEASSASLCTLAAAVRREVLAAASNFYNECAQFLHESTRPASSAMDWTDNRCHTLTDKAGSLVTGAAGTDGCG